MSFGGRLAQIRAIQAWTSARRAWPSAEEFGLRLTRPCRLRALNALPLPARGFFARGEGGGSGAKWFSGKVFGKGFLLHLNSRLIATAGKGKRERPCGK
jgi:hypothetical protein